MGTEPGNAGRDRPDPKDLPPPSGQTPATRPLDQSLDGRAPARAERPVSGSAGPATGRKDGVAGDGPESGHPPVTRAAAAWTATIAGLVLLVLLIVFISQNQVAVPLRYFGLEGNVTLGLALLVAAVAGGVIVASVGAARILQLRAQARRGTGSSPGRQKRPRR